MEASHSSSEATISEAELHTRSRDRKLSGFERSRIYLGLTDNSWHGIEAERSLREATGPTAALSRTDSDGNCSQREFLRDLGRQCYTSALRIIACCEKGGADLIRAQLFVHAGLYEGQVGKAEHSMD